MSEIQSISEATTLTDEQKVNHYRNAAAETTNLLFEERKKIHNLKADMNSLVKQWSLVRNCQIHYFKTRQPETLYESKNQEAQLSELCRQLNKKWNLSDYD